MVDESFMSGEFSNVGCGRIIETHQRCRNLVGLDDSTPPYDKTSQP